MNKLPSNTAKLITSLQVITVVESAVKELVENSLDAGASSIEVRLENYGLSKIEVGDNGTGIKKSEVEFAAQVHYTSKISCQEDLDDLHTYGFRGEALSSLCEVAEVFITTRTKDDAFSTKYSLNHGGKVKAARPCHLVQGTIVTALDLFNMMPVRRQLYHSPVKRKQALKRSEDILMSFALIYPSVQICLIHNGSIIWQKPKCGDVQNALENVLGSAIMAKMTSVQYSNEQNEININAFIPTSNETKSFRKSNDRCFIYVNRRPVHDRDVESIIKFHTGKGSEIANPALKWPAFFLEIEVPYNRVDVNVVSDKSQVMICSKDLVLMAVEQMLSEAYSALPGHIPCKESTVPLKTHARGALKDSDSDNLGHRPSPPIAGKERQKVETFDGTGPGSWSEGQAIVSNDGVPIEPVRVLGCSNENQPNPEAWHRCHDAPRSLDDKLPASPTASEHESPDCTKSNATHRHCVKSASVGAPLAMQNIKHDRLATARQNCVTSFAKNRSRTKNRNSTADTGLESPSITKWMSESSSPSIVVKNNVGKTEFCIAHKKQVLAGIETNMNTMSVGTLSDMKVGVVLDCAEKILYLAHLTRLQEARLFYSLMENHSLQAEDLPVPLSVSVSSLCEDARKGLDCLIATSDPMTLERDYTDERICKNGFKVALSKDVEGQPNLHIKAISGVMSFYGINDLTGILSVIGINPSCTVFDSRPFKVVHYLQAEAVRMSRSLPVDISALRRLDELRKYFPKRMEDWICFHEKAIFQTLFDIGDPP